MGQQLLTQPAIRMSAEEWIAWGHGRNNNRRWELLRRVVAGSLTSVQVGDDRSGPPGLVVGASASSVGSGVSRSDASSRSSLLGD